MNVELEGCNSFRFCQKVDHFLRGLDLAVKISNFPWRNWPHDKNESHFHEVSDVQKNSFFMAPSSFCFWVCSGQWIWSAV
jgi:hypothetical protein